MGLYLGIAAGPHSTEEINGEPPHGRTLYELMRPIVSSAGSIGVLTRGTGGCKSVTSDAGPGACCLLSREGVITWHGREFSEFVGHPEGKFVGISLLEALCSPAPGVGDSWGADVLRAGYESTVLFSLPSGGRLANLAIHDGPDGGFVCSLNGIPGPTGAGGGQCARFESLAENFPGVIFRYSYTPDAGPRFLEVRGNSVEIWGLPSDSIVADSSLIGSLLVEGEHKGLIASMREANSKGARWEYDWETFDVTGNRKWLRGIAQPVRDAENRLVWDGLIIDVTAEKLARKRLEQNQRELADAQRMAEVGSWTWDIETDTVTWSDQLHRIFGSEPGGPGVSYSDHPRLYTPESWDLLRESVESCVSTGDGYTLELEFVRLDGSHGFAIAIGIPETNSDGKVVAIRGTLQDITAQRAADNEARVQNERLLLATEASNTGLWDWDIASNQVHYSEEWKKQIGYAAHELSTEVSEWSSRLHPEDFERVTGQIYGWIDSDASGFEIEFRFRHRFGGYRWIYAKAEIIRDANGRACRVLGCHIDLTERRKSEEHLRVLETAVEHLNDSVVITDAPTEPGQEPVIVYVNAAVTNLTGLNRAELIGKSVRVLHSAEMSADRFGRILDALSVSRSIMSEVEYQAASGAVVWLEAELVPILDMSGVQSHWVAILRDITARKTAELEVRDSSHRLESLVNSTDGVVWEADAATGQVTFVSARAEKLFGFPLEQWYATPNFWESLVHPEDGIHALALSQRCIDSSSDFQVEVRMRSRSGDYLWLNNKVRVECENGVPKRLCGLSVDITDRKNSEFALSESKARLQSIFDTAQVGIFLADDQGRYLDVNPAGCKMLGYDREEILDLSVKDVAVDVQGEPQLLHWQALREEGKRSGQMPLRRRDGEIVICEYSAQKDILPGIHLAVVNDITAKEQAERALELARFTLDHSAIGMYWIRTDATLMAVNQAGHANLGYSHDELMSLKVTDFYVSLKSETWEEHWEEFRSKRTMRFEGIHVRKDGSRFPVEVEAHYLPIGDQEISCAYVRDISESKRAESERLLLEQQLRAAQKMEAIGTLAGGIAHDFNNILGAILGNLELARIDVEPDSPAIESLVEIKNAASRAKGLVQQILTFSRRQPQQQEPVDLVQLSFECVGMLKAILPSGLTLICEMPDEPVYVLGNSTQLNQVLVNLCTNAWQAMRDGRGIMRIELCRNSLCKGPVRIASSQSDGAVDHACWSVSDTGAGIKPSDLNHIFEPFFTTKGVGMGTGLGLSVVHGIIRDHGGHIEVHSELGRGSTFDVFLPTITSPGNEQEHE